MIKKNREHHSEKVYRQEFEYAESFGGGYSFPCNSEGIIELDSLNPCALKNYNDCVFGTNRTIYKGMSVSTHHWYSPAVFECGCGKDVELHGFTNTCKCGVDYNMSGQSLSPRECWGEETGENLADILSVDYGVDTDVCFDVG